MPKVSKKPRQIRINKTSKKQVKLNTEYSKERVKFLTQHPLCQAKLIDCQKEASEIHHKRGRGIYMLDTSTWLAVCRACHHFIENNPLISKNLGLSENKLN